MPTMKEKKKSLPAKRSEKTLEKKNATPKKRKSSDPPNVGHGRPLTRAKTESEKTKQQFEQAIQC